MTEQKALELIEDLRSDKVQEQLIMKEDFMVFRSILIQQKDRVNFVGIAQKGGNVIYKYYNDK